MSIDARVETVILHENGGGELRLIDRPGSPPGIAGQRVLSFDEATEEVTALNGLNIWGSSGSIMLGSVEIARRDGYTKIIFHDRSIFVMAVAEYHREGER